MISLTQKIKKFKNAGFKGIFLWVLVTFRNYLLWRKYHFTRWHISENFYRRPYKSTAVDIANSLDIENAVELGCGLGDIISRLNVNVKVGIDNEEAVILAAKDIHSDVRFKCGTFSDAAINFSGKSILLMIEIVHNISPENLLNELSKLMPYYDYLLLERMDIGIKRYKFHHDFQFLNQKYNKVREIRSSFGEPGILTLYKSKEIFD